MIKSDPNIVHVTVLGEDLVDKQELVFKIGEGPFVVIWHAGKGIESFDIKNLPGDQFQPAGSSGTGTKGPWASNNEATLRESKEYKVEVKTKAGFVSPGPGDPPPVVKNDP